MLTSYNHPYWKRTKFYARCKSFRLRPSNFTNIYVDDKLKYFVNHAGLVKTGIALAPSRGTNTYGAVHWSIGCHRSSFRKWLRNTQHETHWTLLCQRLIIVEFGSFHHLPLERYGNELSGFLSWSLVHAMGGFIFPVLYVFPTMFCFPSTYM